jgi:tRNA 2-thiouridine synthesizing protein A
MPIVNTAKALRRLPPGSLVEVLTTDPGSVEDFHSWALMSGHEIVERSLQHGTFRFLVLKH